MADVIISRSVPLEPGRKAAAQSLPVTIAVDQEPIPVRDALTQISDIKSDQFGVPLTQQRQFFLQETAGYGIDRNLWYTYDNSVDANARASINYLPDKTSVELRLTGNDSLGALQTRFAYRYQPGKQTSVSQAIQTSLGAANANVIIQWGEFTRRDGYGWRLLAEYDSVNDEWKNELYMFRRTSSVTPTTGGGLPKTGVVAEYPNGFQTLGNARMYRPSYLVGALGTDTKLIDLDTWEEIIKFTEFNQDRLTGANGDGPPGVDGVRGRSAHALSFIQPTEGLNNTGLSNLCMFLIQRSWYGGSGGKGLVYVPDQNSPANGATRWITAHQIRIGDTLPVPSMESPDMPVTYQIAHRRDKQGGSPGEAASPNAFVRRYGVSVWIDGGDPRPAKIDSASSGAPKNVVSNAYTPMLAIAVKPFVWNNDLTGDARYRPQKSRAYPIQMSLSSTRQTEFYLIKNPTNSGGNILGSGTTWFAGIGAAEDSKQIAAVNVFTATYTEASGYPSGTGGKIIGAFYCGANAGVTVDLTEIFDDQRELLGRAEQVAANAPGDILVLVARCLESGETAITSASLIYGIK